MYYIPTLQDVELIGVADPGVPNKERIILRPWVDTNLQSYVVGLGKDIDGEGFVPIGNRIFFFTQTIPESGSWVIVYTGEGVSTQSELPTTGEKTYTFFWGFKNVIFLNPQIIPILYSIGSMISGTPGKLSLPGYRPTANAIPRLGA